MAALFGGALAASLIGPVLGMIPSATGGPQNPFTGTSAGNPLDPLLGLLGGGSSSSGGGLFGSLLGGGSSSSSGSGSSSSTAVSPTQTMPMYIPSPTSSTSTSATGTTVSANTMASAFGTALASPLYLVGGVVVLLLILR